MSEIKGIDVNAWNVNQVISVVPVLNERNGKWLLFRNGEKQETPVRFRDEEEDYYDDPEFEEPVIGVWDAEGHYLVRMDGQTSWGIHIDKYMPDRSDVTNAEKSLCLSLLQSALDALERYLVDNDEYHLINHQTLLQLYLDCLGLEGDDDEGDSDPCTEPCERDCETEDEILVDFKINGWSIFRSIDNQGPGGIFESKFVFHADVLGITRNSLDGSVGPYSLKLVTRQYRRRDLLNCDIRPCQGRWLRQNYRIGLDWDEATFGSPYRISWAEVDPGQTTFSLQAGLSSKFKVDSVEVSATVGVTISYTGSAVVNLGDQNVFYCDPIMRENDTGSVTFRCN
ncbi:MAG: hypothetical protein KF852_13920 [Saprospiraceae bacterium]|nr:hypothetical protein [Saprospiraceae bacterium]